MKSIKSLRSYKTARERRSHLEKATGVSLKNIGKCSLDEKAASSRNCENMIGAAQIPLGIAGPLQIKSQKFHQIGGQAKVKSYYIPLATTEGALVASVNRGCKAVTESGGAMVAVETVGTTRGPVFKTNNIGEGLRLKKWLDEQFDDLAKQAASTSSHLTLKKLGARVAGKFIYMRFYFDTQDAMGMNMVTIATEKIVRYIETKTGSTCLSVAGNFDIDKKPAFLNSISGRGKRVWAEVVLSSEIIERVLKTTAEKIYDVWLAKCMIGSAMSGSLGFNAHFANVIAALFLATGQDLAHVGECSVGITTTEVVVKSTKHRENTQCKHEARSTKLPKNDLHISVYLPDVMVGTVGGGTSLATQKEALTLLGVFGGDEGKNAMRLAKIVGAAVLAGEISLLASLAEGTLASAHEELGRRKSKISNFK